MSNYSDCDRESSYKCPDLVYSRRANGANVLTSASSKNGGKSDDEFAVCGGKLNTNELSGQPPRKSAICPLYDK